MFIFGRTIETFNQEDGRLKINPQPGDVLEFFEQKRIIAGMCLSVKGSKIHIITETSRQMNLAPARILHHAPGRLPAATSRSEAIGKLREICRERIALSETVNLPELWNHLDAGGTVLPVEDMVELAFPSPVDTDHEAAIIRAILDEKVHFVYKDNSIRIEDRESVERARHKIEQDRAREKQKQGLIGWVKSRLNEQNPAEPEGLDRFINALTALAVDDPESPDRAWIKDILKQVSKATPEEALILLEKLGCIDPDENLEIIKYHFPREFTREAVQELEDLELFIKVSPSTERRDLRTLKPFTIDGELTRDMDDAISINRLDNGWFELGIHITDVTEFVADSGILDQEACDRGQTLYLPDQIFPMFPRRFTEDMASLIAGGDRLTISTMVTFSPDLEITGYSIFPAIIRIHEKLSYETVNTRISEPDFKCLLEIAKQLRGHRIEAGAIIMPRPELEIRVNAEKEITIQRRNRETVSQVIVSEMMILANRLAADTAAESQAPFPFRCQKKPRESVPVSMETFNPYISYRQRRLMTRAETSVSAKPHFSLGLNAYTNITSPLRRYFDVIAQRQLKSILLGEPLYTADDLERVLMELETASARASQISHSRYRYWLFKHLATLRGQHLDAIVLDRFPNRYQIWLKDYFIDADIPTSFGKQMVPEQVISVTVEKVSPRQRLLRVRLDE